ncbi:ABC transporter permease [Pedobacter aquatilis]|uniref:ABC transporter permease n=1 Tax=Pedobacter aquatilis TaxID=351343 RepID=UPI00292D052A|nr:DUF3526 domain-containing protein [Pedobacter aquatilis]
MIKQLRTLIYFEWLNFKAEKGLMLFMLVIFSAGLYGIFSGHSQITAERKRIAALDGLYQDNIKEMKSKYPDSADAGDIGYYHSVYAKNKPDNWAMLSIGQRDISPSYLKIRLLAVQNQLYAAENTNPYKLSVGSFDLSFVFVFLFPLFIVAISFNVLSQEKEQGTLALLLSFPLKLQTFLLAKFIFRFLLVLMLVFTLSVIGWLWIRAEIDGRAIAWLSLTILYVLFWFAISFCIIALKRNSAFNAVSLLGIWLLIVIIIPVLVNTVSEIKIPVDDGLKLSLIQRQEVHGGWDKPRGRTMQRFFARHPELKDTASVEGAFKWKWYFAFQELGDAAVEPIFQTYIQKLNKRAALASSLNVLSPAAKLQQAMNSISATNYTAQLDFMLETKKYHERLKAFYYPFLFKDEAFLHDDFSKEPQFEYLAKTDWKQVNHSAIAILLSTFIVTGLGFVIFKSVK